MRNTKRQGLVLVALATCAAAVYDTTRAALPVPESANAAVLEADGVTPPSGDTKDLPRLAARDMAETYYQVYRIVGSHVLNLDGRRIGEVSRVVLDDSGEVEQVMIMLTDASDADGGAIAVSPYRAEIVSTNGALVSVIRIDLSREELVQAQLVRLKWDARAPALRGAEMPDQHRDYGPLY